MSLDELRSIILDAAQQGRPLPKDAVAALLERDPVAMALAMNAVQTTLDYITMLLEARRNARVVQAA